MSAKERDRLKVLHEVRKRHITQRQAAVELGISVRWVRTLLGRLRVHGDAGLRHRLRGKRSNRKAPEERKRRAVQLYRQKKQARLWHDYGPTLASEELAEQHGIHISRETLRHWLIEAKLWRPRRARVERAHVWRARRARYGELVQWEIMPYEACCQVRGGVVDHGDQIQLLPPTFQPVVFAGGQSRRTMLAAPDGLPTRSVLLVSRRNSISNGKNPFSQQKLG